MYGQSPVDCGDLVPVLESCATALYYLPIDIATQDTLEPIASHSPLDPPDVGAIILSKVRIILACDNKRQQTSTQTKQSALTLGSVICTDSGERRIQHPTRCVALETRFAGTSFSVGSSEYRPEAFVARPNQRRLFTLDQSNRPTLTSIC